MKTKHSATLLAILAAALSAINIPLLKILLQSVGPNMMAAFLYLGAGLGVFFGMLLGERPDFRFYLGLGVMLIATILMVKDTIPLQHTHAHSHTHTHEHRHGQLLHTHPHGA